MKVDIRCFCIPKGGHTSEEYEDAFWCESEPRSTGGIFHCAIADGASESSFSDIWAKLLTRYYCYSRGSDKDFLKYLHSIQKMWSNQVSKKSLPWYAEEKLQYGAFSTLTGLTLNQEKCSWKAISVGDSCLFQIRKGRILTAIPYDDVREFTLSPILLCSSTPYDHSSYVNVKRDYSGQWLRGDHFFLMTDAMAFWFLNQPVSKTIERLMNMKTQGEFKSLIERLRNTQDANGLPFLRNDDTTFVRIGI